MLHSVRLRMPLEQVRANPFVFSVCNSHQIVVMLSTHIFLSCRCQHKVSKVCTGQQMQFVLSIQLSSNSTWYSVGSWLICILPPPMFGRFIGAYLDGVCRFERRTFYNSSFRVNLTNVLKWVQSSMNRNRLHFIQIQTLPPSMQHKVERNYLFCMQNNQENL